MKKDMDLVRELLESIAKCGGVAANERSLQCLDLMEDEGLVENICKSPSGWPGRLFVRTQLTCLGCEFLKAAHDESAWMFVKTAATHMGGMAFYTAREILLKLRKSNRFRQLHSALNAMTPPNPWVSTYLNLSGDPLGPHDNRAGRNQTKQNG